MSNEQNKKASEQPTMWENDDDKLETPESTKDNEEYPQAFKLLMIIVALILSMFLVRILHQLHRGS
jgi:hypothetical protein